MADNISPAELAALNFTPACDEAPYSGDTGKFQIVTLADVSGTEGSKVVTKLTDSTGVLVHLMPRTTGGQSSHHKVAAATNNATSVKASAGQVYNISAFNSADTPRYVKLYDKASAPSPSSDVPVYVMELQGGLRVAEVFDGGKAFALGIAYAIVTNIADNDDTAVSANDVSLNLGYK